MTNPDLTPAEARAEVEAFMGEGWMCDGAVHHDGDAIVWAFAVERGGARFHPTQKPVELPARAITNSCEPGGVVYEPFAGSGSTLIACEQLGRRCRAIEFDPTFVAKILARWEKLTGRSAVRVE